MTAEKHPEYGYPLKDADGNMSVQEIIRKALEAHGREDQLKDMYRNIMLLLKTDEFRMVRQGNTMFLIQILSPGECKMAIFNGDSPKNLLRNIKGFYDAMLAGGYHTLHTDSNIPNMVQALRNMGMDVEITGKGRGNMENLTIRAPQ